MGEKERKEEEKKKLVFRVWEEPVFRPPRVESGKLPFATGLESVEKLETEREAVFCSNSISGREGYVRVFGEVPFFFFFLPGSIPGRNFRNSKQWEKKGRGEMMDEGRREKRREGGGGVSRTGVGDDESVRSRDADRSSSARSQLDGGKHERMTLEHVYMSRR